MQAYDSHDEIGFLPHHPGEPEAINSDSFDEDVLDAPVPVLVEFWAARCAACRRLAPEIVKAIMGFHGAIRVFTLNVDEELEAAIRFDVRSIPAALLFVDGVERARHIGPADRATLVELFGPYLTGRTLNDASREDGMPKITWDDAEDIGIELSEKYPDMDPLTVRFTDLHRLVTELSDFADDPATSNEGKLEMIQMAWLDEYKETHD